MGRGRVRGGEGLGELHGALRLIDSTYMVAVLLWLCPVLDPKAWSGWLGCSWAVAVLAVWIFGRSSLHDNALTAQGAVSDMSAAW